MPAFRYSTSHFPLVIVTCPPRFDPIETKSVLDAYTRDVLQARKTFVLVVDATAISELPSASVRRVITDWMAPVQELGAQSMLGMTMATSNVLARGAMTAINWVVPPKVPMHFPATMLEAVRWGETQLRAASVPIGPELAQFIASFTGAGAGAGAASGSTRG